MRLAPVIVASALLVAGCHESPKTYQSTIQLWRYDVVDKDGSGKPLLADVEVEWEKCPGDQMEVVRGDAAFATCMSKYKIGDVVPAEVIWAWDDRGYYQWDVTRIGDCPRPPQGAGDTASFEEIEECDDLTMHGQNVGFTCNRKPHEKLASVCPWMRR